MRNMDVARLALENRGRMLRTLFRSKVAWGLMLRALRRNPLWIGVALATAAGGYMVRRHRLAA